jgi:hypothetical protein
VVERNASAIGAVAPWYNAARCECAAKLLLAIASTVAAYGAGRMLCVSNSACSSGVLSTISQPMSSTGLST